MSEGLWDSPNQQVVRADSSGPGDRGEPGTPTVDEMTKAQLLEYAQQLGISPANNAMSKEELHTAVRDYLGAG